MLTMMHCATLYNDYESSPFSSQTIKQPNISSESTFLLQTGFTV